MSRRALRLALTQKDRTEVERVLAGGLQEVRVVQRALALLLLAEGASALQVFPDLATRVPQTAAWNQGVNRRSIRISWRFDRKAARRKSECESKLFKRSKN